MFKWCEVLFCAGEGVWRAPQEGKALVFWDFQELFQLRQACRDGGDFAHVEARRVSGVDTECFYPHLAFVHLGGRGLERCNEG